MSKEIKADYNKDLQQKFVAIFDKLELQPLQKDYLENRWLDQVMWMEKSAKKHQKRYYWLRGVSLVGGVIVPALVGLRAPGQGWITATTIVLSIMVALGTALEEFFKQGARWRHYRRTVEMLKSEGWKYIELSGDYKAKSHADAFEAFTTKTEFLLQSDVDEFIRTIAQENQKQAGQDKSKS